MVILKLAEKELGTMQPTAYRSAVNWESDSIDFYALMIFYQLKKVFRVCSVWTLTFHTY